MRTPKSRLPKDFSLEDRLAGCAQAVERKPETWRGRWHAWEPATTGSPADDGNPAAGAAATDDSPASTPRAPYDRVLLDLGCGKGEYTVACARLHPETLYIGLDVEGVCVMRGAELALAKGVPNAVTTPTWPRCSRRARSTASLLTSPRRSPRRRRRTCA